MFFNQNIKVCDCFFLKFNFLFCHLGAPLDLHTDCFYPARKDALEGKFKFIAKMTSGEEFSENFRNSRAAEKLISVA